MKFAKCIMLLISLTFLVAGCGLPKEAKESMLRTTERLKTTSAEINKEESEYKSKLSTEDYKTFLSKYAERENWVVNFSKAKQQLAEAQKAFDTGLKPVFDKNSKDDLDSFWAQTKRVESARGEALKLAKKPKERASFLLTARKEAPQWLPKAQEEEKAFSLIYKPLTSYADKMKVEHIGKKDDITSRLAQAKNWNDEVQKSLSTAKKEIASAVPDYALFADSCGVITKNLKLMTDYDKSLRTRLSELDRSYSKTLIDMRVEYYVQVGRVSWDESSDWDSEHDYQYPVRQVDEATYEYFDKLPDEDPIALYGGFLSSSIDPKIDHGKWNLLKINEKENWSSGDSDAEFYVAELPAKHFHKYMIVENGEKKETDWVVVSDAYFEQNEDNLGMDLEAKPFGFYNDETIKVASPAGMAYVGNPKYGNWKNDGNGGSFWEFYGRYRLFSDLLGPDRYYRNDWNDWHTNYSGRKPYYGETNDDRERFGSGSATSQTRYAGSHYARSGGFKGEDHSVRNAGPRARGGGPGGGGK
jgi:hypothetical protein